MTLGMVLLQGPGRGVSLMSYVLLYAPAGGQMRVGQPAGGQTVGGRINRRQSAFLACTATTSLPARISYESQPPLKVANLKSRMLRGGSNLLHVQSDGATVDSSCMASSALDRTSLPSVDPVQNCW